MRESNPSWQKILADGFTSVTELLTFLQLSITMGDNVSEASFKTRVPRGFAALMEKGNPLDPLLLQVLAQSAEQLSASGYSTDPLQEQATTSIPGLLHKYHGRVLITLTGACAVHCRYCFRRHFPYDANQPARDQFRQIIDYIQQDVHIHEVILSGGDPLLYTDDKLQRLFSMIESISHIKTIRFHTRVPVVLPERITHALLNTLERSRCHKVIVLHSNHANELDERVKTACKHLKSTGSHLLNQSVLLKHVNNDVETLLTLSHRLFDCGVLPYYLHLLDPVLGSTHFEIPIEEALRLFQAMQARLPGYLVPRLAREQAGHPHKTWVHPFENQAIST